MILPLYDHPLFVAGLYPFQRIFLVPRTIRAGEGFPLAEERVIRRPVLITQTFTSGVQLPQQLCRRIRMLRERALRLRDPWLSERTQIAPATMLRGDFPRFLTVPRVARKKEAGFQRVLLSKLLDRWTSISEEIRGRNL